MRILHRSGNGSPEWGGRKKRQRQRVIMAVCFVVLAVAGACAFIWVAYQRSLQPQLIWQSGDPDQSQLAESPSLDHTAANLV